MKRILAPILSLTLLIGTPAFSADFQKGKIAFSEIEVSSQTLKNIQISQTPVIRDEKTGITFYLRKWREIPNPWGLPVSVTLKCETENCAKNSFLQINIVENKVFRKGFPKNLSNTDIEKFGTQLLRRRLGVTELSKPIIKHFKIANRESIILSTVAKHKGSKIIFCYIGISYEEGILFHFHFLSTPGKGWKPIGEFIDFVNELVLLP